MDFIISVVSATPLPSLNCAPFSGAVACSVEGLAADSLQLVSAAAVTMRDRMSKSFMMG